MHSQTFETTSSEINLRRRPKVYQAGGNTLGRIDMDIAPSNNNYLYAIVQAINPTGNRGGVLGATALSGHGGSGSHEVRVTAVRSRSGGSQR